MCHVTIHVMNRASEIGILSPSSPRLITSFLRRSVPRGTNGGVSWTGTLASVAGGAFIGAGAYFLLVLFYVVSCGC